MASMEQPSDFKIAGRLSFPYLTAQSSFDSAHRENSKLKPALRPKTVENATANFQILLNQFGLDKTVEHLLDNVTPWFKQEIKSGSKRVHSDITVVEAIDDALKSDPFKVPGTMNLPFSKPSEQTLELMPNAVAALTVKAFKSGVDIKEEAFVSAEEQLVSKPFVKKAIFPLEDTVFELYPGAYVKSQINFWLGDANGTPYLKANSNAVAFWKDGDSFLTGGGSDLELLGDGEDDDMFDD